MCVCVCVCECVSTSTCVYHVKLCIAVYEMVIHVQQLLFIGNNNNIILLQAGALLACGIVNVGVRNECDPALALLSDYVLHASSAMRLGAVIG